MSHHFTRPQEQQRSLIALNMQKVFNINMNLHLHYCSIRDFVLLFCKNINKSVTLLPSMEKNRLLFPQILLEKNKYAVTLSDLRGQTTRGQTL